MKSVLIAIGVLVAGLAVLLGAVFLIGSRLPRNHVASSSVHVDRPVAEVYQTVRNLEAHPKWRTDLKKIDVYSSENGRLRFREDGTNGIVNYQLAEDIARERVTTKILDEDLGYSGSWTYTFEPDGAGTRVTLTERGEVSNPLFRFLSHYVFGHSSGIDRVLLDLSNAYK